MVDLEDRADLVDAVGGDARLVRVAKPVGQVRQDAQHRGAAAAGARDGVGQVARVVAEADPLVEQPQEHDQARRDARPQDAAAQGGLEPLVAHRPGAVGRGQRGRDPAEPAVLGGGELVLELALLNVAIDVLAQLVDEQGQLVGLLALAVHVSPVERGDLQVVVELGELRLEVGDAGLELLDEAVGDRHGDLDAVRQRGHLAVERLADDVGAGVDPLVDHLQITLGLGHEPAAFAVEPAVGGLGVAEVAAAGQQFLELRVGLGELLGRQRPGLVAADLGAGEVALEHVERLAGLVDLLAEPRGVVAQVRLAVVAGGDGGDLLEPLVEPLLVLGHDPLAAGEDALIDRLTLLVEVGLEGVDGRDRPRLGEVRVVVPVPDDEVVPAVLVVDGDVLAERVGRDVGPRLLPDRLLDGKLGDVGLLADRVGRLTHEPDVARQRPVLLRQQARHARVHPHDAVGGVLRRLAVPAEERPRHRARRTRND